MIRRLAEMRERKAGEPTAQSALPPRARPLVLISIRVRTLLATAAERRAGQGKAEGGAFAELGAPVGCEVGIWVGGEDRVGGVGESGVGDGEASAPAGG